MADQSQRGTPVTAEELYQAAHVPNLDAPYRDLLILVALGQLLTRVEALQQQVNDFRCRGVRCAFDD